MRIGGVLCVGERGGKEQAGEEEVFHGSVAESPAQAYRFGTFGGLLRNQASIVRIMDNKNRSVAARTLIMAGALVLGVVAAMAAKGLIASLA